MGHISDNGTATVMAATLDMLVEDGKILAPDCVKIDIEGAEVRALHGARRTVQRSHPVLFVATHSKQLEKECYELLDFWGYHCRSIQDNLDGELGEVLAK